MSKTFCPSRIFYLWWHFESLKFTLHLGALFYYHVFFFMPREPLVGEVFTITLRHTTLASNPLDEWSSRRSYLYLKTHNTHKRHIHAAGGIRNHNSRKLAAADPRIRPRGHWQQQLPFIPDSEIVLLLEQRWTSHSCS